MRKISYETPLDNSRIAAINRMSEQEEILVVFSSTKGLTTDAIRKFNSNITISIIGGLTPLKRKFNNNYYQKRTYYSPKELIEIITKFETIERNINPIWSDEEKMMYVYQKLCEYLTYNESYLNGRDASRNLLGMITGQSVCSGCAIIFTEAMTRLGIKCYYQNMQSNHSWNIVTIGKRSFAIDLTWDVYNKRNNTCQFKYFCRESKEQFYSHEAHDVSRENEEKEYDITPMSLSELEKMHKNINKAKIIYLPLKKEVGRESCTLGDNTIVFRNGIPINMENILMTFTREDGSSFMIIPTKKEKHGVYEYIYLEKTKNPEQVRCTKIYSESELITMDYDLRENIANNLLSQERLKTKINNFNGYVGYLVKGSTNRYYNQRFEEEILNIYR